MEAFLLYIGKAALGAGTFYLAYLALFQHQKHFVFNRIYLPVSLAVSFVIPLITFTTVKYIQPVEIPVSNSFAYLPEATILPQPQLTYEWYHYLFAFYAVGVICFLGNLFVGHLKAMSIIRFSHLKELFGAEVNITQKDVHPFSFFNLIVVSKNTLENPSLEMIVNHEMIHVKERHTLDILFAEILFLFQWFNPFAWLIRDAMRNNLEYLTDHQITKKHNAEAYQLAMVGLAHKKGVAPFLTALNGSQLKNRIIMMKKKTENRYSLLKQLIVLPLLAILVMGLSNKEVKTEIVQNTSEIKILVDGEEILKSDPVLKNIDFSKGIDGREIMLALGIEEKVISNGMDMENNGAPSVYFIRTSDYVTGTNPEFDKIVGENEETQSIGKPTKTLYAIDGKILSEDEISKIEEYKFESTTVFSGEHAVEKFGEIAKDATVISFKSGEENVTATIKNPEKESTIKGKVTNEKGEPIPAAAILVKGTTVGTISDFSGNYELKTEGSTLVFSMIGYEKKEIEIDGKTEINVKLRADGSGAPKEIKVAPAQNNKFKVKGTVSNKKGEPIPATAIVVKGSTVGTISDFNGNYEIQTDENATLVFSMVGCEKKEIEINGKSEINVKLKADKSAKKDEVKVIGYGKQGNDIIIAGFGEPKSNLQKIKINSDMKNVPLFFVDGVENKNIDWINPENIKKITVLKDEQALSLYGEKAKNGAYLIETKTISKLVAGEKSPIYFIDGVKKVGGISDIDKDDIETISVLKGESATSLYGVEGEDGVIIITTKKAKSLAGFKILFELDNNKVEMEGLEGCSFKNLNFTVKEGRSVSINQNGMTSASKNNEEGFLFKLQKENNEISLRGKEGTSWQNLDFTAIKGNKYLITEKGVAATRSEAKPLLIVDGKKYKGDINDLAPDEIETMTVLKDEAALANYGAEAKNGVILITTKLSDIHSQNVLPVVLNGKLTNLTLMEVDRNLVDKIERVQPEEAVKKYGKKGKDGVFEVTSRKLYTETVDVKSTAELEAEKNKITTPLQLRKFIAGRIKYPAKAQDNNIQNTVKLWAVIEYDGEVTHFYEKRPLTNVEYIDEVVVTGYKTVKNTNENQSNNVKGKVSADLTSLLTNEVKRVMSLAPKIEIPECKNKTVEVTVKFVLQ